ncbi:hypothetical protein GCM10023328_15080 [Modestobacter marinus]|uniref:Uncharacterized protein n=1 Tax=Modestobacter marinus TaxID=477641 RepID=A0ABQ2FW63_9ACTN|nr:hypothetical protein GCM10011589_15790 [Modestobacter marinus]
MTGRISAERPLDRSGELEPASVRGVLVIDARFRGDRAAGAAPGSGCQGRRRTDGSADEERRRRTATQGYWHPRRPPRARGGRQTAHVRVTERVREQDR